MNSICEGTHWSLNYRPGGVNPSLTLEKSTITMSKYADLDDGKRNSRCNKELLSVAPHYIHSLTSRLTTYADIMIHDLMSLKHKDVNAMTSSTEWIYS